MLFLATAVIFANLAFPGVAKSEDFNYDKAYSDYLYKLDVYRNSYTKFTKARDFYLQSKTLTLKEEARLATYDMLVARDDLMAVYLTALRMKLLDIPDHPGAEKGDIISDIPGEVSWFTSHKASYNEVNDSLDALFAKNQEVWDRWKPTTAFIVYQALSRIAYSHFLDFKIEHEKIYTPIKAKVEALEGSKRIIYDRWIKDIDSEFQKVTDIEVQVHNMFTFYRARTDDHQDAYEIHISAMEILQEAQASLLRINSYLFELLTALNKDKLS